MSASAGLLWVLAALSPWHLLYSPASPLLCIYNISPVMVGGEVICLNSNWRKKLQTNLFLLTLPDLFVIEPRELYCWHKRETRREGQAQYHSILAEIQLNFRGSLLKTLSMSQALGARYVLSLSYSLNYRCCCFLLPSIMKPIIRFVTTA